jgi:hypothetical protein
LLTNEKIGVSALLHSGSANEKIRVSELAQKIVGLLIEKIKLDSQ